jgi:hypothetical protein
MKLQLRNILKIGGKIPWHKLLDFGVPLGVGAGTAGLALSQGQSPTMSLGYGAGAGMATSPRFWRNTHMNAKFSDALAKDPAKVREILAAGGKIPEDYISSFGKGIQRAVITKALPVAGAAALTHSLPILNSVDNTAKSIAGTAKNTELITNNINTNAPALTTNLNATMVGMRNFWDPRTGTVSQLSNSVSDIGKGINNIVDQSKDITKSIKQVGNSASQMGGAAQNIGNLADRGVNMYDNLAGNINNLANFTKDHKKLILGLLLSGGALGTGALLAHKKKKNEINHH